MEKSQDFYTGLTQYFQLMKNFIDSALSPAINTGVLGLKREHQTVQMNFFKRTAENGPAMAKSGSYAGHYGKPLMFTKKLDSF
jgi:hypothetical protein